MKKDFLILFLILLFVGLVLAIEYSERQGQTNQILDNQPGKEPMSDVVQAQESDVETVVENLRIPWEIIFLPDSSILVTERTGTLRKIGDGGFSIDVPGVENVGEGGLLGMAAHPNFDQNKWLYLYYTTRSNGRLVNVVERYSLQNNELRDKKTIISDIPAGSNHDGGRIAFGPDGFLYITTGEAGNGNLAQDTSSLAGKILRLDDEGGIPSDNPFGNAVYSYGHRNSQGIAWDDSGRLWSTEHGRSGAASGYDELNLIEKGKNYGWPVIQGSQSREGMETPVINSGPNTTWAPGGLAYHAGSLFFTGLRGQTLYEINVDSQGNLGILETHFQNEFGRLRSVKIGSDGYFYLLTSNTDGRGTARDGDDRVLKVRM